MCRTSRSLALPVLLTLAACSHGGSPSAPRDTLVSATLGREFDLPVGARAEIGDDGLAIVFLEVREDSRCAIDVVCVWAGDAAVLLSLSVGRAAAHPMTLHTTLEPTAALLAGYSVRLIALSPYPDTRDPIEPDEYVARLLVERAPAAPTD